MIRTRSLVVAALVIGVALLFTGSLNAGTKAEDVMKLEAAYPHTKGIVQFSHKKHSADYKATCGDCHHDKDGKALAALKDGDAVQKCIECHKKPGEKPKGKDAPKLDAKAAREFHAEALHDNCQGCHKEWNKKNNSKAAPTTCAKCHGGKD